MNQDSDTPGVLAPTQTPVPNPYETPQEAALAPPPPVPSPYDPEAKGLDGDALDALLKARMDEGIRVGYARGSADTTRNYAEVFAQGVERGRRAGVEDTFTRARLSRQEELHRIVIEAGATEAQLLKALKLARGEKMRDALNAALSEHRALVSEITARSMP